MAVIRQFNVLGQERIDVPHLRSIESAVAADFDVLMGMIISGKRSMIVSGFKVSVNGVIGAKATSLQVVTAGSVVSHYNASESGTIFFVPASRAVETLTPTNVRVLGSFTANAVNYVGIDIQRTPDDTTADTAMFLDADTLKETPKTVPLGRTLDYVFVISTTDFSAAPSVAAVAKVTTDASNNVIALEDARDLMFRLGLGGSIPDVTYAYPWPEGRLEISTGEIFTGGDKPIDSLKSWMDAIMTRLWEVGGGERWFSSVSDRNVKLIKYGTFFTNGEYFEWDGTHLHWKGLKFVFPNSTGWYNDVANQTSNSSGLTDLADGECIYVDIDYSTNRTGATALLAAKTTTKLLGSPTAPGSRHIIAWRVGTYVFERDQAWPVGSHFTPATTTSLGVVKLSYAATDPALPIVLTSTERDRPGASNGTAGGVAGLWRTNATSNYDVLGTGLFRGSAQGSGNIRIGRTANDQTIFIGGNDRSVAGAGVIVGDLISTNWFTTALCGTTFTVQNAGVDRFSISSRGDIKNIHNLAANSINISEDAGPPSLTYTVGSGFEDVDHIGAGAGTIVPTGNSGGVGRDIHVKITVGGTAGDGTCAFAYSYDSGLSVVATALVPAGNITLSDGVILTFSGSFILNDVYRFRPRFVPQATFSDKNGRVRHVIDHTGFPMGRRSEFRADWMKPWSAVTSIPGPSEWVMTTTADGAITATNADSNFNAPGVFFGDATTTSGDTIALYTSNKFAYLADTVSFVAEWEAISNSANNVTVQMGLRDAGTFAAGGMWFYKTNGGNWFCTDSASGVAVDTGLSSVGESTAARFRMEVVGTTINGLAQKSLRFWINERLVSERVTSPITAGPYLFSYVVKSLANTVTIASLLGPLHCQWNRHLSSPAL